MKVECDGCGEVCFMSELNDCRGDEGEDLLLCDGCFSSMEKRKLDYHIDESYDRMRDAEALK